MRLSYEKKSNALRHLLNEGRGQDDTVYVKELFDDVVVFTSWNSSEVWQQGYSFDDSGKPTLKGQPKLVEEVTIYKPVKMSADLAINANFSSEETVRYSGPFFKLGSYPDKGFELDDSEADAEVIPNFSPFSADNEHADSQFDGKLGGPTKIWREGDWLHMDYDAPRALFNLLGKRLKVSATFQKAPKRLIGLALAKNPRITDAALTAAFSAARSEESMDDATFLQKLKAGLVAIFGGTPTGEPAIPAQGTPSFTSTPDPAKDAEIARLKALVAANEEAGLNQEAAKFADDAITVAKKATPAERDSLVRQFKLAARADAQAAGSACFSADGKLVEGENLGDLRKGIEARPVNPVTAESVGFTVITGGAPAGGSLPDAGAVYANRKKQSGGGGN